MSALALPAVRAALHERLTSHAATSGLNWPEEGEPATPRADFGRVDFVSGVTEGATLSSRGAEELFDVSYFTGGQAGAEDALAAIDAALESAPLDVEGATVLMPATSTRLLDESAAGGFGFHAVVTPVLQVSAPR